MDTYTIEERTRADGGTAYIVRLTTPSSSTTILSTHWTRADADAEVVRLRIAQTAARLQTQRLHG